MVQIFNIDTDEEHDYSHSEESDPEEGSRHRQQQSRSLGSTFRTYETQPATGVKMTPKIPPSFDGQSSWFEFEDLIDDWVNITTLTAEKLGPSLKNALTGNAEYYEKMLDNEQLRHERNGITYFKETLRPYFVKGADHVFLWRFTQLFRTWRGNGEFVSWIARFEVASKKVLEAFMGLLDLSTVPQADDFDFVDNPSQQQYLLLQGLQDPAGRIKTAERIRSEHMDAMKQAHRDTFPLSDNLMSLIFLVQSDLNERQRERFVASMALRQINMNNYTYLYRCQRLIP